MCTLHYLTALKPLTRAAHVSGSLITCHITRTCTCCENSVNSRLHKDDAGSWRPVVTLANQ